MEIKDLYDLFRKHSIICTDTRKIENGCLFFALKGDNFNGNKFAEKAITQGASYVIIDEVEFKKSNRYILVGNVLKTLQQLANYHRHQFNIPFIGITGTNGKTTTKEFIAKILSTKYKVSATKGNLNNHIGVPLTLLSIAHDCEMAIIEMGANHVGEIALLCEIVAPNFGIITNIGTAHIEGFGSVENIKKTKSELYRFIQNVNGTIFINNDDNTLLELAKNLTTISYGNTADCKGKLLSSSPFVRLEWENMEISSNLYGSYNYNNILAAICIGNYFNVAPKSIKDAIENYSPDNNRSQTIKTKSNTIFLDAYNANPTSMKAAIDTFKENEEENKLMILGDMLELGNISKKEHQEIVTKTNHLQLNAIFIGKEFNAIDTKFDFTFLENVEKVIDWLKHSGLNQHHILIKGSRGIQLEKAASFLQQNS